MNVFACHGNQHHGNQHHGNQHHGNQHHGNKHHGNKHVVRRDAPVTRQPECAIGDGDV